MRHLALNHGEAPHGGSHRCRGVRRSGRRGRLSEQRLAEGTATPSERSGQKAALGGGGGGAARPPPPVPRRVVGAAARGPPGLAHMARR